MIKNVIDSMEIGRVMHAENTAHNLQAKEKTATT